MTVKPASGKDAKLVVYQGATFDTTWQFVNPDNPDGTPGLPINLSNRTARLQMRPTWYSNTVIFELTTENGGITIDGPNGLVSLYMPYTQTDALPVVSGVYDMELDYNAVNPDDVDRVIEGEIYISPQVTR